MLTLAAIVFASASHAQVTGVTATGSVTRTYRADVTGVPIVQTSAGTTLAGTDDGNAFGSGASFQTTSRLEPDAIYFKNANAAAGQLATVDSYTVVDIAFRNDGPVAVRPTIESTILPAGIGLYVGPNCLVDVASCGPGSFMLRPQRFDYFGPSVADQNEIAGASFDFLIRTGSTVLYQLKGSLSYRIDPLTGTKTLVSDLDDASNALNGFSKSSADAPETEFGFQWDATPISVQFGKEALLAPGEESSITYETRVVSYSFAACTTLLTGVCLNSYSAFGDPLGKGSSQPSFAATTRFAAAGDPADPLSFEEFRFSLPTFENGTLTYQPILATAVPEPATWLLLVLGFGLVGAAARSRRHAIV